MESEVQLKSPYMTSQEKVSMELCIICQGIKTENLTSTENGQRKVKEVASIKRDLVWRRLQESGDQPFKYHLDNSCYKSYTHPKSLKKFQAASYCTAESDAEDFAGPSGEPVVKRRRSLSKARPKPSQSVHPENLKCVICSQYAKGRERKKYRISEGQRAENLQKAASYFMDELYTRIVDLDEVSKMFAADLYCHASCYSNYIRKWNLAKAKSNIADKETGEPLPMTKRDIFKQHVPFLKSIIDRGRGLSLSDIRDMINKDDDADIKNNEIKRFLIEEFGDAISFCDPEKKNQSSFVFSSSVKVQDVINSMRNLDIVKTAATEIRKSLLEVNFGLDDRFCDAQELKHSWKETNIPEVLLTFFATLLNTSRVKLLKSEMISDIDDDFLDDGEMEEENEEELHDSLLMTKTKSLFQIMFYQVTKGRHKTPLHIMNAHAIYERCRSRELITAFNKQSTCISYKAMKGLRKDLAKYSISKSLNGDMPLPSHFDRNYFTIVAMDNFDNADRNSLSGRMHAHDTAITVFQEKPDIYISKPPKTSLNISNVPNLSKLPCQEICDFHSSRKLPLNDSFEVEESLYLHQKAKDDFDQIEFIISTSQSLTPESGETVIPSWAGIRALLSEAYVPQMQVGFLPFLPNPVTEYSTVFSAMTNFTKLLKHLKQDTLPLFCDEGVFRIVIDIYLQRQDQFQCLIPMLGGFHAAKCLQHSIGKYIKGSGLEESLRQTRVFGVKIVDSVLGGTHYVRSLKGILILANAIEMLKWSAFAKKLQDENFTDFENKLRSLQEAYAAKNPDACKEIYQTCLEQSEEVKISYKKFANMASELSEMVRYLEAFIKLVNILKNLIAADREGNWHAHLQAIQDMLPVFCQSGSINYQRYCSFYLEKMRKLPVEHPEVYKEFLEGKFVVKTSTGFFNAVSPDMKLEQSIQRSKKGAGGIIGQTKQQAFVTEWELAYHEILAISKCYNNITKSVLAETDAKILNKELRSKNMKEYCDAVKQVFNFLNDRGNPYEVTGSVKLHHFITKQTVPEKQSQEILNFFENGTQNYIRFREERFQKKEKKLSDTIKRITIPQFLLKDQKDKSVSKNKAAKSSLKSLGKAQKKMDIARLRGHAIREILQYDLIEDCPLFDEVGLARHKKHEILKPIENHLLENDYKFERKSDLKTAVMVDFMSLVRKVPFKIHKNIKEALEATWSMIMASSNADQVDIVYDSYIQNSIKESERVRRSEVQPIDIVDLGLESIMPVDLKSFWSSTSNKQQLQTISRKFYQQKSMQCQKDIILSGYVTDAYGEHPAERMTDGVITEDSELCSSTEEADSRIIPHIAKAGQEKMKRIVVLSNDTDVVIYTLAYYKRFFEFGIQELWVQFGIQERRRNIPIHKLAEKLGEERCLALLKAHILTGCDVTSKLGTKASAFASKPESYLRDFGKEPLREASLQSAETYLVRVVSPKSKCETFDNLRYDVYKSKEKALNELPPTSNAVHGHLLRSHYFVYFCTSLLDGERKELEPRNYGWRLTNGMLAPNKNLITIPFEFTMKCRCRKGCVKNCGCRRKFEKCTEYCGCIECENI